MKTTCKCPLEYLCLDENLLQFYQIRECRILTNIVSFPTEQQQCHKQSNYSFQNNWIILHVKKGLIRTKQNQIIYSDWIIIHKTMGPHRQVCDFNIVHKVNPNSLLNTSMASLKSSCSVLWHQKFIVVNLLRQTSLKWVVINKFFRFGNVHFCWSFPSVHSIFPPP